MGLIVVVIMMLASVFILSLMSSANALGFYFSAFASIIGMVAIYIIVHGRPLSSLKTNTDYIVMAEYHSDVSSVLELKNSEWPDQYTYKISCTDIKGGCPHPWPKKFKAVIDGSQYIIVPLESAGENIGPDLQKHGGAR